MSKTCFVLQVVFEYALCSFDHMYIPNLSHPAFSSIGGRDSQCWRAYSGGSGREEELFFEAHPGEQTWCCIFGDLVTWCHYSWNDSWWKNIIYIYVYDHIYTYTIIVVWFWHVLYGNALYAVSESHQHLKTYMCTFTIHKRPPKPELSIYSMHANSFLGFTRWTLEQIYVTKVLVETAIPNGLQANKKGGCTITVRKRGGWKDSFLMAQKIAGWI